MNPYFLQEFPHNFLNNSPLKYQRSCPHDKVFFHISKDGGRGGGGVALIFFFKPRVGERCVWGTPRSRLISFRIISLKTGHETNLFVTICSEIL